MASVTRRIRRTLAGRRSGRRVRDLADRMAYALRRSGVAAGAAVARARFQNHWTRWRESVIASARRQGIIPDRPPQKEST